MKDTILACDILACDIFSFPKITVFFFLLSVLFSDLTLGLSYVLCSFLKAVSRNKERKRWSQSAQQGTGGLGGHIIVCESFCPAPVSATWCARWRGGGQQHLAGATMKNAPAEATVDPINLRMTRDRTFNVENICRERASILTIATYMAQKKHQQTTNVQKSTTHYLMWI